MAFCRVASLTCLLVASIVDAGPRVASVEHATARWATAGQPGAALAPRTGTLEIAGAVPQPVTLRPTELRQLPRTAVRLQEDGRTVTYEGVLVAELLKRAGVPLGNDLRGQAVASYLVATAADGYQAVFALPELDPEFTGSEVMVADTVDGKPLFDYQGPLRLVAPRDRRGARSVRMLERLELVRLQK